MPRLGAELACRGGGDLVYLSMRPDPPVSVQLPRAVTWLLILLQENLQIYLKSTQGPIEVYLCPEEVQEPDSPTKEPLVSTSALSPSPDSTQPSSSTSPGITEPTASSGKMSREFPSSCSGNESD